MTGSNQHSELLALAHQKLAPGVITFGAETELARGILNLQEQYENERQANVALSCDVTRLSEQLEALQEKPDQPLLNAARRLVKATDNAERNYALGDLYNALDGSRDGLGTDHLHSVDNRRVLGGAADRVLLDLVERARINLGPGPKNRDIGGAALDSLVAYIGQQGASFPASERETS